MGLGFDSTTYSTKCTTPREGEDTIGISDVQMSLKYKRYYSMYGHVKKLAHEILKGANSVAGVEASPWRSCRWRYCKVMAFQRTSLLLSTLTVEEPAFV
ncbi:unnamed protein product [Calypogeia fissa]